MFHPSVVKLMKNDTLLIEWINSIHIHFILTKNLNLDKYLLSIPKNYKRKIKILSFDYNISKINLIPILIYEVIRDVKSSYNTDFIKYIFTLNKINSKLVSNKL